MGSALEAREHFIRQANALAPPVFMGCVAAELDTPALAARARVLANHEQRGDLLMQILAL